jgi:hypothetical protein
MTMNKKISLYFAMLALFQLTNCTNAHMNDSEKYPQKSTKDFNYEVIKDTRPAPEDAQHHKSELISDEKFSSLFGAELDRKRVTEKVEGGKIIRTTEIWTSKKYSPVRLAVAGTATLGAAAAGAGYLYNNALMEKTPITRHEAEMFADYLYRNAPAQYIEYYEKTEAESKRLREWVKNIIAKRGSSSSMPFEENIGGRSRSISEVSDLGDNTWTDIPESNVSTRTWSEWLFGRSKIRSSQQGNEDYPEGYLVDKD